MTLSTEIVWIAPAFALLIGYVLGSIPFGVLLTRAFGDGDLRQIGSGNIGATNVLRTGCKGLAAATLILDLIKGLAAVLIVRAVLPGEETLAAAAALIGHCYPVWLRFRGGKGVATLMGIALGLHWPLGLVFALLWLGLLAITRYSSLAGMIAAISTPVTAAMTDAFDLVPLLMALAAIVLWKHRGNIARLIAGTEPRVGRSASADTNDQTAADSRG